MHKAEGNRSWREEENRGRGEKQQEGLEPGLGLFGGDRDEDELRAKTKGRPGQDGPLEIMSWRCSTFPRKNAQYHRRWRA